VVSDTINKDGALAHPAFGFGEMREINEFSNQSLHVFFIQDPD
jgi:hypothetical protein